MKLLLDTHTLIWWLGDKRQLSQRAVDALQNRNGSIFVSAASAWEIAIKVRKGKLDLLDEVRNIDDVISNHGFAGLPITLAHASRAGLVDWNHADPFDRMLAAQSELENLMLVTKDPAFASFGVKTLW